MKIQNARFLAALGMILLCYVSAAQANSLSDLLGLKPGTGQTYTHNVAGSGQSQYSETVKPQAPAYPIAPGNRIQAMDVRQSAAPGSGYQQSIPQTRSNSRQVVSSRPLPKEKANSRVATKPTLRPGVTTPTKKQPNGRIARVQQPIYLSQPSNPSLQRYRQPPPAYYTDPYLTQRTSAPNYYQGYSYNTWGPSTQSCAPGRA